MLVIQNAVRVLAMGCACAFLATGCDINNTKDKSDSSSDSSDSSSDSSAATKPDTTTQEGNPSLPSAPGGIPAGSKVAGNKSADGSGFGNGATWIDGSVSMDIRCLANDEKVGGIQPWYFCDDIVRGAGALQMILWPDGQVVALGSDFVSSRSGLVYKFKGFTVVSSGSGLITQNPHVLSRSEQAGTFRGYWVTYQKP